MDWLLCDWHNHTTVKRVRDWRNHTTLAAGEAQEPGTGCCVIGLTTPHWKRVRLKSHGLVVA